MSQDEQRARERAAAIARIRQYPDPVLRERAREVDAFDDDLAALAERMLALMEQAHGAGLAAPQVGLLRRILVYRLDGEPAVLVNPEVVSASDETEVGGEGCLSLEALLAVEHDVPVERHLEITVRHRDVVGEEHERTATGLEARVIQHELDHLDGRLIIDRAAPDDRKAAMRILRQALTGT